MIWNDTYGNYLDEVWTIDDPNGVIMANPYLYTGQSYGPEKALDSKCPMKYSVMPANQNLMCCTWE